MCKITVDGYKMSDGTLIPFKGLKLQNIPVHHIEELNKSSATAWDIVLLRNSMEDLKDTLLEENKKHSGQCPINKKAVTEIVHDELRALPSKTLDAGSKIADKATKILVLLLTIVTIINLLQ